MELILSLFDLFENWIPWEPERIVNAKSLIITAEPWAWK